MSRVIKTVGSDGAASGGAGLSTSDVNTLIEAKGGWEFIKDVSLSSNVSSIDFTGEWDNDTYDQIWVKIRSQEFTTSHQIAMAFTTSGSSAVTYTSSINHYNSSYNTSQNTNWHYLENFYTPYDYINIDYFFNVEDNNPVFSASLHWNAYMGGGQSSLNAENHQWGSMHNYSYDIQAFHLSNLYWTTPSSIKIYGMRRK